MKKAFLLYAFLMLAISLQAKTYNTPYGFIENKGQIIDQNNNLNPAVKYLWTGNGMKVQLKGNSFSYEVMKTVKFQKRNSKRDVMLSLSKHSKAAMDDSTVINSHRVDIELLNSNPNPEIIAEEKSADYDNYYTTGTPEEGVTFVYHYSKVTYKDIYPNIDLEFVSDAKNEKGFKYNFIVHPGGNVADIQLQYKGATNTTLNKQGNLAVATTSGDFEESIPKSYLDETGENISVHYAAKGGNIFGFIITQSNLLNTLIIDPWVTYYGGNSDDVQYGSTIDSIENIYAVGYTFSSNNIATSGSFQSNYTSQDAYLVKFQSIGIRLWGTYYGNANGNDLFSDVKIDHNNNIDAVGNFGVNSSTTVGAYQNWCLAESGFLAKFSTTGIRIWATYFGDSTELFPSKMDIDNNNNIYITGGVYSGIWGSSISANFCSPGAFQTIYGGGGYDAFLAKFNTSGNRVWTTLYGGDNPLIPNNQQYPMDYGYGIKVDDTGNVYMAGFTQSVNNISTINSFQPNYIGGIGNYEGDAFLVKFNNAGNRLWGTYYGGSRSDNAYNVDIDTSGNVILSGASGSISNIATAGSYQINLSGPSDGFIAKFAPSGNRLWGSYYGGNDIDGCNAIPDKNNNIIIYGYTKSTNGIASVGSYQPVYGGGDYDVFLAKLNSNGANRFWGTYYGGNGTESANLGNALWGMLRVNNSINGNIQFAANTSSTSNIATANAFQSTYGGGTWDAMIAMFDSTGSPIPFIPTPAITNNSISPSQTICANTQPILLNGSSPSGGNGSFGFVWLQSTTNATSGFSVAIGTNNIQNYQPSLLNTTTWYKRIVSSGNAVDTSAAAQITVNAAPIANITASGATTFCQGNNVTLNANTGAGFNYQWYDGSNTISGATNATYLAATGGSYIVQISNSNNCNDTSNAITVTVNPVPTAIITAGGNTTICNGEGVNLNAQTATGYSYQWYNGNTILTGATNATYLANASGSYTVMVDLGSCSDTSNAIVVTVNALPSVIITQTVDTFYSNGSFNTYQWYLNGTAIAGATNPNYTATQNGNYYVMVTDANNCSGQSNTILFTVGIDEVGGVHLFSVSPNPFKEGFVVNCPTAKGTIIVSDLIGKILVRLSLSKPQTTIDMKGYATGVYFVKYEDGEVCETVKVVKE